MDPLDARRAASAAVSAASRLGLTAEDAIVLNDSNKLALRLRPCDVLARVAHDGQEVARFEVELAERLERTGSPARSLDHRVEARVHRAEGFAITFWSYHEPVTPSEIAPAAYAHALRMLHHGMRTLDVPVPHFMDQVDEAQRLVGSRERTPALADGDRALVINTLERLRRAIGDRSTAAQILHGEPHRLNVLNTRDGPLFIDLETCCRGPIEFDLAYVPDAVSALYPGVDEGLLRDCRHLVLARVAALRCDPRDQLPNGQRFLGELLRGLRQGPPWPTLDEVGRRAAAV